MIAEATDTSRLQGGTMARRTAQEAARTRASILRTATRLFGEKGFADTSLDEIATRSRVTKGAVYHHFADKRAIFVEVFGALERELDAASRATAMALADQPRAAFLAGCRVFLEFAKRSDYHRIMVVDGPSVLGPDGWHAIDTTLGLPTLEGAVEGLMAVGLIEHQPSKPLAILLFGALNEAGFALARGEPGFEEEAALAALGRILDGLAAPAA
jgi:AcrR family transcriptional regulator